MKFKEVIIVVLIMLIFAMAMLMYIVINDSIKASSVPIISNNIENITCGNKNNDGDNANNKVNKIENHDNNLFKKWCIHSIIISIYCSFFYYIAYNYLPLSAIWQAFQKHLI